VDGAPLFPLERFADQLTEITATLGDAPGHEDMSRRLDELLGTRFGGFVAAEKCRDRAIAFHKRGSILRAINELHRAKIGWFADETLRGAVLAMLLLSVWYRELGLAFAAKQYALAAAFVAADTRKAELKRYLPPALLSVADSDYLAGNWCDFAGWIRLTACSHHLVPNQDETTDADENEFQHVLLHASMILMTCERMAPDMGPAFLDEMSKLGLSEHLPDLMSLMRSTWAAHDVEYLWGRLEEDLQGRPFSDVGPSRFATWSQLGITWEVVCNNSASDVPFAEQFIATAQIVLADLAELDLCLLRTKVRVEIQISDSHTRPLLTSQPSNNGRVWALCLPATPEAYDVGAAGMEILACIVSILDETSLAPSDEVLQRIESAFKAGLSSKVYIARPYVELYRQLCPDPRPFAEQRTAWTPPEAGRVFHPREHAELGWHGGPGPRYTQESSAIGIRNRYERGVCPAKLVLRRLARDGAFMEIVSRLRNEGWLDWHLVLAITNIVVDYRVVQPGLRKGKSPATIQSEIRVLLETEESYGDIWVPNSHFTEAAMRNALQISQLSTLANEGLHCKQSTPDLVAINDFLKQRYGYWSDDVEHRDPLGEA
jgi:hypothetical protein